MNKINLKDYVNGNELIDMTFNTSEFHYHNLSDIIENYHDITVKLSQAADYVSNYFDYRPDQLETFLAHIKAEAEGLEC